ncbi:hypothetical protein HKX41_06845 [Salinisphaera sp. USBA-960]|nr:hypothetical protein [Salifodinibacter halophilus]
MSGLTARSRLSAKSPHNAARSYFEITKAADQELVSDIGKSASDQSRQL